MKITRILAVLIIALAAFGCIESSRPVAMGQGTIRSFHSAVTAPNILFLLEERAIGPSVYKETSLSREFDGLDYTANFDYHFTGDLNATRLASTPFTLVQDTDYLFIFTGSLSAPGMLTWENPIREWAGTETVLEVWFGHLSPQLGEVDLYFAAPGTAPVLGEARATLTNENRSPLVDVPEGDYVYIITTKDDPTDILFTSETFPYFARNNYLISIHDADPSITAPISVRGSTRFGGSQELADVNSPPTLRIFHASFTTGPVDLYSDGDFTAPMIANVAYEEVSAATDFPPDIVTQTFTDAGNVGSILLEAEFGVLNGFRSTRFLAGNLGGTPDLATLQTTDNFRSFENSTKIRFIQTSTNHTAVNIYVVEAGVDIADVPPRFVFVPFSGNTGYIDLTENDYEVYVTTAGTEDILAGPFPFTATNGDVVQFAVTDNVDPNLATLINYDHLSIAP